MAEPKLNFAISHAKVLLEALEETRKEIKKLENERDMLKHYATGYGGATSVCQGGYPQRRGLICGLCQQDRSQSTACNRDKSL